MKRSSKQPRAQALVLIAFAILGIVAITGLAVDGGNIYSDRRHAQNAADTAALAAGLARVRQNPSWQEAGQNVAASNGYKDGINNTTVTVDVCPDIVTCHLPAQVDDGSGSGTMVDTDPSQFVKVTISSKVRTYFAPVVGIRELANQVDAVVRAIPAQETQYFNGSPLASLMPHCKKDYPGWPNNPFEISGSGTITVKGSPIFDNSDCEPDFDVQLSGELYAHDGITLRGTYDRLNGLKEPPVSEVKQHTGRYIDPQSYSQPQLDDECKALPQNPKLDHNADGSYTAHPGRYTGTFPPTGGGDTVYLSQGLYCLYNGLTVTTGTMTTDLPGGTPKVYDPDSEGVLFYVPKGDVDMHGNAFVNIHAITLNTCPQSGDHGLLIYLPYGNNSPVSVSGSNGSVYTGSIIAPSSLVTIAGSSGTSSDLLTLETQIVGFSIKINGGGLININFNKCLTATTLFNPLLQPYK